MKSKYFIPIASVQSIAFALCAVLGGIPVLSLAAPPPIDLGAGDACLGGHANYTLSDRTGFVNMVGVQGGSIGSVQGSAGRAAPVDAARGYLARCGASFGLRDQAAELQLKRQSAAEKGGAVVKFQQSYEGIPVFASELNVQINAAGAIQFVNGELVADISLATAPEVSADEARLSAARAVADAFALDAADGVEVGNDLETTVPELWVYDPELIGYDGPTVLVWRIEVSQDGPPPIRQLVLVNAQEGSIALSLDQLDRARNRMTYDMNNGTTYPGTLRCNEANTNCTGGDTDEVNAHIFAADTYNFYKNRHGRDSIDNAGMTLNSHAHYDTNYCNAFWNGSRMTYGDGCTIVVDDVVAHEMTHGVTQYESNLVYANQSGAINESFSDIWGEFVDLVNGKGTDTAAVRWLMGEDTSIGAIRNMKNPPQFEDPDRMGSPYYYTGTADNGGVHTNSGVGNKTAYLITDGATFNGWTVTGIGIDKAAKIFYKVQADILTPSATYATLGVALSTACNALVGTSGITTANCDQVRRATYATEIRVPDPRPLAPIGTTTDTTPTYRWTKLTGATAYSYTVYNSAGTVVYSFASLPATSCGTSDCSHTPTTALARANYTWKVRAQVGGVWKPYSPVTPFTVSAAPFNSQFTTDAAGWTALKGTWSVADGFYQSNGVANSFASSAHVNNYATLTYQVRMRRTAADTDWSNSIWIRGTPSPLTSTGLWSSGYLFQYTNTGYFSIFEVTGGSAVALVPWTASAAIIKNGWNTLKVSINSSNGFSKWYINNTLVAYGTLSTTSKVTGRVGVAFYRDSTAGHLNVDWATLVVSAPTTFDREDAGAAVQFVQPTAVAAIVQPSVLFKAPPAK